MATVDAAPREYVRICPVCETENPPAAARCACGASLGAVDFSLKRAAAPAEPTPPVESPPQGAAETAAATTAFAESVVCPHPDCAQPNPRGQERCVYCNRPLSADASLAGTRPLSAGTSLADTRPLSADASLAGSRPLSPASSLASARPLFAGASLAGSRPLPAALRDKYRVVDAFTASGAEADLLLVEEIESGERRVAKLYRKGIEPDFDLLSILSQTVGDVVVRVLAHGISEGVAFELLEYIAHGTLQEHLRSGPLAPDDVRRIVKEIADALNGIHAHRILHRDLKPENVLLRSKSPLELALTDFGIASFAQGTQHFTSGARTTKYAAPEALIGVIDEKSDWWSLGMITFEAATGRHPFDGLSEQVMNHHLATKPIDVRGVYDDELRRLCRGLLLRDPKRRWGSAEVARWLEGDATLAAGEDSEGPASVVRPYRLGATESTTAADLGLALAKHWDAARKDLARGQIGRWLEHELHDYNLLRRLRDIEDYRDLSADARLLRFLLVAAPDLPPIWKGIPVSRVTLLAAARQGVDGDGAAKDWLDSIYSEEVLALFAAAGDSALGEIGRAWREGWARFIEIWQGGRTVEEAWRKTPRAVAGLASAEVVSFDDLVYTQAARLAPPAARTVHPALLLAQLEPEYAAAVRGEVIAALAEVATFCAWIEALWNQVKEDAIGILVVQRMLPRARDDAALEMRRQTASKGAQARLVAEARQELRARLTELLDIAPDDDHDFDRETFLRLLEAVEPFQLACQKAAALGFAGADCEQLSHAAEKLSAFGSSFQHALARCERVQGVNAIFLRPQRLLTGAAMLVVAFIARLPWIALVLLIAAAVWLAYRWVAGFQARGDALSKLALLRLHGNRFLDATES